MKNQDEKIVLSICIATLNRASFIGDTLTSITSQLKDNVELVILDGASSDNTSDVVNEYCRRDSRIRYFREPVNSGVDADFDKSVSYARGDYCWLMTDDDLLADGAVERVLDACGSGADMIVVNSELRSANFDIQFSPGIIKASKDRHYLAADKDVFFTEIANYISYIGAVVARREFWLGRERQQFYGSLFIHVGVAFQNPPIANIYFIAKPQIIIRYGNAMWTPRRFHIWMFMWPELIWSFQGFSNKEKQAVVREEPWRSAKNILLYKAIGGYGPNEYREFLREKVSGFDRLFYYSIAVAPPRIVSIVAILACIAAGGRNSTELYDISLSPNTGRFGRWLAGLVLGAGK